VGIIAAALTQYQRVTTDGQKAYRPTTCSLHALHDEFAHCCNNLCTKRLHH